MSDTVIGQTPPRLLPAEPPRAIAGYDSAPWNRRLRQQFLQSLRAHSLFIVMVVTYVVAGWLTPRLTGVAVPFSPDLYSTKLFVLTAAFLVVTGIGYLAYIMIAVRPAQLLCYLGASLRDRVVVLDRLWTALPVFLLLPLLMSTFTYFKFLIPYVRPFTFDHTFAQWDRSLHLGYEPWELLQPILGYPLVSAVVNSIYNLWLFVLFGVLLWQSFSLARPRLRMRYLISFVLIWILLGHVAATLLSSAGPVYYGRVTGLGDPFAPLMAYLHQVDQAIPLPALVVQEMLWHSYANRDLGVGSGISAMPSLHVATSFSFALLGFAIRRWLGILFVAFVAAIMVGSVHLGWHYAIDGYVAIVGTWAIWWMVGWFLDWPMVARLLWGDRTAAAARH
ncbi:MAG: phosphatase PAP2 family protein [Dongiaceae bacterium]